MPWNYSETDLTIKLQEQLKMPKPHILKLKEDLAYLEKQPCFGKINYIILFGSCSKGIATLCSDIDLCIITNETFEKCEIADIRVTLNDDTKFRVETNAVILSEAVYTQNYQRERLYREIGQGIQIYHKGGQI